MEGETEGGEDKAELHALSLINLLCLAAARESHDRIFFGSVFTNICKRLYSRTPLKAYPSVDGPGYAL